MNGIDTIFKTAEKLFSERSFNSVSMDQIAQKSRMSKGNLYHHFKSKEDLYNQLLFKCHQRTEELLKKTENIEGTYLDKIRYFIKEHLKILKSDPQKTKLLLKEFSDLVDKKKKKGSKQTFFLKKNVNLVVNLIDQAKHNKEITSSCDSKILAIQLLSPTFIYLVFEDTINEILGDLRPENNNNLSHQVTENLINGLIKS
ncbi:MAG: TetR/AcrR family transcriptional regulator [Gammaproteobacteria bacterium]|nr:TetR/AcrR family transcriptional regulator [Gammaproteobacteria bacterium]MBT5216696.1 TetR/AcrR family transcriptional regulator [Gammaproteobacteria bacterium]MBT5542166.1 TetR/AcrR family transcriptional regulator [Gammaproteobacteria bacterium]MBT6074765.1 TetR/AcrR family transcriptional regulator [Gammaproteobacteria bacterium]MBT7753295.1 TetR/AcrR family transcriptional regulator [Gammaproteobacteria bacterium]